MVHQEPTKFKKPANEAGFLLYLDLLDYLIFTTLTVVFISGYADGGDAPDKIIKLVPGAVKDAESFLSQHPETSQRFEKVSSLVDGFESPFGLELLSTVHWIIKNEPIRNVEDVVKSTHLWNSRKKQFSPRQIKLAVDILAKKGWNTKADQLTANS